MVTEVRGGTAQVRTSVSMHYHMLTRRRYALAPMFDAGHRAVEVSLLRRVVSTTARRVFVVGVGCWDVVSTAAEGDFSARMRCSRGWELGAVARAVLRIVMDV